MNKITLSKLIEDLIKIGIVPGDTVMVHSSVKKTGELLGGPNIIVEALLHCLGQEGTLMAYVDWESGIDDEDRDNEQLRDEIQVFNKYTAKAARYIGILPEFIRTWPGSMRSDHPDGGVSAIGKNAAYICRDQPLNYCYGKNSPLAKLIELKGKVLLLGAPLDTITLLHYAEHLARLKDKRIYKYKRKLLIDNKIQWVNIEEYHTGKPVSRKFHEGYFVELVSDYLRKINRRAQKIGDADSYLLDAEQLNRFAILWMENREKGL